MKNIVLISCHCDTEEKLDVLRKNIEALRTENLEFALISHLQIPESISSLCHYVFITKENPIFKFPQKCIMYWLGFHHHGGHLKIFNAVPDYGYAGINHIKRLGEIFLNYDYDQFNFIIYDTILDEYALQILKNNNTSLLHPFERNGIRKFPVGLHLISLTRSDLISLLPRLSPENYLSNPDITAEDFIHEKLSIEMGITTSLVGVSDLITYIPGDPTNHSSIPGLFFSIILRHESTENINLFFYNCDNTHFSILVNDHQIALVIPDQMMVDLGINKQQVREIYVNFNGEKHNITRIIENHSHSHIIIE